MLEEKEVQEEQEEEEEGEEEQEKICPIPAFHPEEPQVKAGVWLSLHIQVAFLNGSYLTAASLLQGAPSTPCHSVM